KCFWLYRKY
ncbi:Hemoglobin and hemoglobin-haptoglobin-binding protein A precursor, partial [Haemophilus influenzae]